MAKDMHQKRKERKEAKTNEVEKVTKTNINWLVLNYGNIFFRRNYEYTKSRI